jgi:hypothetical protein
MLEIITLPKPKILIVVQVFNGMAQHYRCFIKDFVLIMAPNTKLLQKIKDFKWTTEC